MHSASGTVGALAGLHFPLLASLPPATSLPPPPPPLQASTSLWRRWRMRSRRPAPPSEAASAFWRAELPARPATGRQLSYLPGLQAAGPGHPRRPVLPGELRGAEQRGGLHRLRRFWACVWRLDPKPAGLSRRPRPGQAGTQCRGAVACAIAGSSLCSATHPALEIESSGA